ncbi:MAG: FISUMP domain-containing protein [Patescibacteria group bacterium]|nr:FISUMP domain-containing protein [Patescibacteria group bacterium]
MILKNSSTSSLFNNKQGFIFPILVFTMAAVMVATLSMMSILVIKLRESSLAGNCDLRANYAAKIAINRLLASNNLSAFASCTAGRYVNFSGSSCDLPGSTNTITALDNDCSYSAQINTRGTSSVNINAVGRCNLNNCRGSSGAIVKINANVSVPGKPCPVDSTVAYQGKTYKTFFADLDKDGVQDAGECWLGENLAAPLLNDETTSATYTDSCGPSHTDVMGYLYDSSMSTSSICMSGWHLPTQTDWNNLITEYPNNALLPGYSSGFEALMAGYYNSGCNHYGTKAFFWVDDAKNYISIEDYSPYFYQNTMSGGRFSVRCIK